LNHRKKKDYRVITSAAPQQHKTQQDGVVNNHDQAGRNVKKDAAISKPNNGRFRSRKKGQSDCVYPATAAAPCDAYKEKQETKYDEAKAKTVFIHG
jgi:hypothetical protein